MQLEQLLAGIAAEPEDDTGWLALADWCEEQGDAVQARQGELTRLLTWLRRHPDHPERPRREEHLQTLLRDGVPPRIPTRTDPAGLLFRLVPPGTFWMGSPENDPLGQAAERPYHRVTLRKAFWMGAHPVTQEQWRLIRGTTPSSFEGDDHPVESVTWDDAQEFCQVLSRRHRSRYRLPTEAEWEYAYRAGTTTQYYTGNGLQALEKIGWFWSNSKYSTHPVGQLLPNAFGLHDLSGLVQEWCADWFQAGFLEGDQVDPVGPATGTERVQRGGAFNDDSRGCRSSSRFHASPTEGAYTVGFRVLLEVG